jgi:hypothetical protein
MALELFYKVQATPFEFMKISSRRSYSDTYWLFRSTNVTTCTIVTNNRIRIIAFIEPQNRFSDSSGNVPEDQYQQHTDRKVGGRLHGGRLLQDAL